MNIVFMGTPEYAKVILEVLIDDKDINISAVFTQPDREVGRKRVLTPPIVKVVAKEAKIDVFQPTTLKDDGIKELIESMNPDFIVVAAYGQILPKSILDIAPCINLHASILPKYRGASPIQQAILNGDEYSGVTAMLMDEGLDTGDILGFKFIQTKNAPTLDLMFEKLSYLAASLTVDILKNFNNLNPIKQVGALSSHCKKITKQDGLIIFDNAQEIYRKFCGYFGWPGIFLESGLKLIDIELNSIDGSFKEGELIDIEDDYIVVGCKIGSLKIKKLQPPSKAKMDAKAYILGKRISIGDTLL